MKTYTNILCELENDKKWCEKMTSLDFFYESPLFNRNKI